MKTNSAYCTMDDELEIDDTRKEGINGIAMLIGLIIPLIVCLFLLSRSVFEFLFRKITGIVSPESMPERTTSRPVLTEHIRQ